MFLMKNWTALVTVFCILSKNKIILTIFFF